MSAPDERDHRTAAERVAVLMSGIAGALLASLVPAMVGAWNDVGWWVLGGAFVGGAAGLVTTVVARRAPRVVALLSGVTAAGTIGVALAAWSVGGQQDSQDAVLGRGLLGAAAGLVCAFVALLTARRRAH